jgi:hypothetical protein
MAPQLSRSMLALAFEEQLLSSLNLLLRGLDRDFSFSVFNNLMGLRFSGYENRVQQIPN